MKPPRPATAKQQSGRGNSVCNKHSPDWGLYFSCSASAWWTERLRMCLQLQTDEQMQWASDWMHIFKNKVRRAEATLTYLQSPWCSRLFIINISCRSACMFNGVPPYRTEDPPPQSESPSEPSYPASMCQSHLNDPDNKTKAINLWYWPGGRVGDNTDAISERQQRRRFSAWGWLETR